MSNIKLSVEERQYLKEVFDRMTAMKQLKIIEQEMGESKAYESDIEPEDLQISTFSSQENYLVLPIHDDHWYLGETKMHPNGSKSISYKVIRKPLGVVEIEVSGGIKIRGEDLRSETYKDRQKKSYFFVYLSDRQIYQEYGEIKDPNKLNEKQEIGFSRINEGKSLYPKFLPFVYKVEKHLKVFRKIPSVFSDMERVEKCLDEYIETKELIVDYLRIQFVLGLITLEELKIILFKTNELFVLIDNLSNSLKSMNEVEISEYFRTKLEPAAKQLINARKVDVSEQFKRLSVGKFDRRNAIMMLTVIEGYLVSGNDLAPSLLEIERRKDRYVDFQKQEFEDQFLRLLKKAISEK